MRLSSRPTPPPFQPGGFRLAYREGTTNHCPACGQTQWYVGRISAQCAFCSTAMPFSHPIFARAA